MARKSGSDTEAVAYDPKKPNESLDLSEFDYKNITGDKFKEYDEFIKTLNLDTKYDFELYKVRPMFKERYEGLPGTPVDFVGVILKTSTPENTTRITVRNALDLNAQIYNDFAKINGKYFLLKK